MNFKEFLLTNFCHPTSRSCTSAIKWWSYTHNKLMYITCRVTTWRSCV